MTEEESPYYAFSVAFRIHGLLSAFDKEIAATGLTPTKEYLADDHLIFEIVKNWPRDLWVIEPLVPKEVDLSDQLLILWRQLQPHSEIFRTLISKGIVIDIYCGFVTDSETGGYSISSEATAIFCELGIDLEVSVTYLEDREIIDHYRKSF